MGDGFADAEVDDDHSFVGLFGVGVGGFGDGGGADDLFFVTGVVDKDFIAGLHGAHVFEGGGIGDAVPGGGFLTSEIGEGIGGGFGFEKPVGHDVLRFRWSVHHGAKFAAIQQE